MQPSVFIPTATIRSVELARANGASSTFDLYVHCSDGATHEFSNISRLEVGPIQAFIQAAGLRTGPADGSDSEGSGVAGATSNEGASESDDPEVRGDVNGWMDWLDGLLAWGVRFFRC